MSATASLSAMSNQELLTELERLNFRVKVRDEKMLKRLRNPMTHAHPCQFWPLCADAYKLTMANYIHYFRWYDFLAGPVLGFCLGNLAFHLRMRYFYRETWRFKQAGHWLARLWMPLTFTVVGFNSRCTLVDCRMYGLDENSREIELYGAMYPDEIETAAIRKKRYEQEYIRIKEQLHDFKPVSAAIDTPNTYFYDASGESSSGYWEQEKLKNERRREIELQGRAKYA
eukprot:TRINITY_DN34690_c0_g1_i1.p1 TRINITY_DN34690_c0_g1~~TRINITY_DN34690_c0_g1_i1.p1  ORF type:complete len:250 (+),score=11.15 TRINITY_DN34690_c0_g1_i1:69-752(+)